MKTKNKPKSRLLAEAHEMAKALHSASVIDAKTMREFDALCLTEVHDLSAFKIRNLRKRTGVSQAIMARVMNVSLAAIKQWERGERHPTGSALKLLNLIESKGLEAVL